MTTTGRDTGETLSRSDELQRAAEAVLAANATRDAFLVEFSDAVRALTSAREITRVAAGLLGRHLGAGQVAYAEIDTAGENAIIEYDWNDGTIPSNATTHRLQDFGADFIADLKRGQRVVVPDVRTDPRTSTPPALDTFARVSIDAFMNVPLVKAGRLVAVLAVHHRTPRRWTSDEIALAEDVAQRTWSAIVRARAEAELRESESKFRTVFEGMSAGFAVIEMLFDATGQPVDYRVLETNHSYERHVGVTVPPGRTLLDRFPQVDRWWIETYGHVALTGESVRFEREAKEIGRWIEVYASRVGGPESRKVAVVFNDISQRKRAEHALRASEERQAFLLELSDALRPLRDPIEIQAVAARVLAERLRVARCLYAEVERERDSDYYVVERDYCAEGEPHLLGRFRANDFGETLFGEMRAGRTLVVDDVNVEPMLTTSEREAYPATGVRSFIAVPLIKHGHHVAIISVQQSTPRDWTAADVALVEDTGERTWAAVERAGAEASLRGNEERRTFLLALSDALRPLSDPVAIQARASKLFGEYLGASRVSFAYIEGDDFVIRHDYVNGVESMVGRHRLAAFGQSLAEHRHQGVPVAVDDVSAESAFTLAQQETFRACQIAAFMGVMFMKERRWTAMFGAHSATPRVWTNEELEVFHDVGEHIWAASERATAEASLREREARLQVALDAANMGTFVWHAQEDRGEPDERTLRLFGLPSNATLNLAVFLEEMIHPDDRESYIVALQAALDPDGSGTLLEDVRIVHPDGSVHWLGITAQVVFDGFPRRAVRMVGTTADLTDRKRTEEALRRSEERLKETDRRKDEFLAVLAHELRNPLAPIRTGLELIRLSGDNPAVLERIRTMMERQVGHMVRLIDDLLDVSRITSGKIRLRRKPVVMAPLVSTAVEAHRQGLTAGQLTLHVELPDAPVVLDVDPTRFVQVVSNLLHNAVKFTDAGGQVRLVAKTVPTVDATELELTVSDTGIGISREMLPRVFDLFMQIEAHSHRSHSGLGIGLALARRLVEMHGGSLDAHSEGPGQGSTFSLRLPISKEAPEIRPSSATPGMLQIRRRVLVIDDNADAANALAMLVSSIGGEPRVAFDGESGLAQSLDFRPHVVLLDVGMPGIDGYETCRRIRQQIGSDVVVVALTGWGQEQDKRAAKLAGFDAHLTKPADLTTLERLLADAKPDARPDEPGEHTF